MDMSAPSGFEPRGERIAPGPRGQLRHAEPMARHVSWRAGGRAARYYVPADLDDLAAFLRALPAGEPVLLHGLGSNLLVRDRGYPGTIVRTHGVLDTVERPAPDQVHAQAGVACPKVARLAAVHGLEGAEFLAGIPGTVGGALAMNAGCYGAETWDSVVSVRVLGRDGTLAELPASAFDVGYRQVALRDPGARLGESLWFVAGTFRFRPGDAEVARRRIREFLARRIATQPLALPNAGSVFRNPPGDHAARLIEAAGLKGRRVGGAQVSIQHANFIVNTGGASAADIESLIAIIRDTVHERSGVRLETEVRIVGDA
jgi:UDP-N-acetylmuramate dehydrogenase